MKMTFEAYFVEVVSTSNIYLDHVEDVAVLLKCSACNMCEDSPRVSI